MNDRLGAAISHLSNLDRSASPVAFAHERENALIEGLHGLAAEYGRTLAPMNIDARGEINFHVQPLDGRTGRDAECGCYGEELAEWLTMVPRRTGTFPYAGHASPDNGWCRLNHFDAERLLIAVRDLMPAMETGTIPPRGDTAPITP